MAKSKKASSVISYQSSVINEQLSVKGQEAVGGLGLIV
jgi:hypothetical protein